MNDYNIEKCNKRTTIKQMAKHNQYDENTKDTKKYIQLVSKHKPLISPETIGRSNTTQATITTKEQRSPKSTLNQTRDPTCREYPSGLRIGPTPRTKSTPSNAAEEAKPHQKTNTL